MLEESWKYAGISGFQLFAMISYREAGLGQLQRAG